MVVFGGSEAANVLNIVYCDILVGVEEGFCQYDGEIFCDSPLDCLDYNTCCADYLEH